MPPTVIARMRDLLALAVDDGRPIAVGWATVDLDRAAAELTLLLGLGRDAFVLAEDSVALGARCRVAAGVLPGGLSMAIVEPVTEGRLAATLAKRGEGPAAAWSIPAAGGIVSRTHARPGPFGPERLRPGSPVTGPHRFLIETAPGTIPP
jgi:hypothetical protein